jgi:membrane protein DedA with SNARE-associated domain
MTLLAAILAGFSGAVFGYFAGLRAGREELDQYKNKAARVVRAASMEDSK